MDQCPGDPGAPDTLHAYIHAGSDPANATDPSGYTTLTEKQFVPIVNDILEVVTLAQRLIGSHERVKSGFELAMSLKSIFGLFDGRASYRDFVSAFPSGRFARNFDPTEAADVFARESGKAIGVGLAPWAAGYAQSQFTEKLEAFIWYLPTFGPVPPKLISFPIPKVEIGTNKVELRLGVGGYAGRFGSLGGVGIFMGKERALWRTDFRAVASKRGQATGGPNGEDIEIDLLKSPNWHTHVYSWSGGRR
jgi:hypothetical protein